MRKRGDQYIRTLSVDRDRHDLSTFEQIEAAILPLPLDEFKQLKKWFSDVNYELWDNQLEQDVANRKLDALAEEAIAEFKAELLKADPSLNFKRLVKNIGQLEQDEIIELWT